MCRIFASLPIESYAYQTRSVRLGGHVTSIRLEQSFWIILEEIAAVQGQPLGRFLTQLHDEVLDLSGDVHNFTSLLRCACLTYVGEAKDRPDVLARLAREAGGDATTALTAAE